MKGDFELSHEPAYLKNLNKEMNTIVRAIVRKPKFDNSVQLNTPSKPVHQELKPLCLNYRYFYNFASWPTPSTTPIIPYQKKSAKI